MSGGGAAPDPTPTVARAGPARGEGLLLSGVAGAVDGIGYVLLHVFTAHVTGNTVHVGTAAGRLDLRAAWHPALAIVAFVTGVAMGALARDACARRRPAVARPVVLGMAGTLLVAFLAVGLATSGAPREGGRFAVLAALAALAMGCQNATAPEVGGRRVRTYITGTMTELAEALVAARDRRTRAASLGRAADLLAVWLTYLVGACVSGAAGTRWGAGAAAVPIAGIAVAVALDVRRRFTEEALGSRAPA